MNLVVKLSGKVLEERNLRFSLCNQIRTLLQEGHRLILVHGGGRQLSDLCQLLEIPVQQVQGRRITDERTLEAAKMVFSAVNCDLTAALHATGVPAIGMRALDGGLTRCHRRPPLEMHLEQEGLKKVTRVDFGWVGEIDEVRTQVLDLLLEHGFLPVVTCLCADESGQILNINADTLACELALASGAQRLVSVSDVDGLYRDPADPSSRIAYMDLNETRQALQAGSFRNGMIPKVENAIWVLGRGLPEFQVVSGLTSHGLLEGVKQNRGTLLKKSQG